MEKPDDKQGDRQIKHKHAQKRMAETAFGSKAKEVLEVGRKTTDNHGRPDKSRVPKWQSRSGLR